MPKFSLKLYLNSSILCKVEITSSYIDFEIYTVFKNIILLLLTITKSNVDQF